MIRFVNITRDYFPLDRDSFTPLAAFISTSSDRFVESDSGNHVFHCAEDIDFMPNERTRERCLALVPEGFFDPKSDYWKTH